MQQVSVDIREEGNAGYVVVLRLPSTRPYDLKRFGGGDHWNGQERRISRCEAHAYREGVADGIHYAAEIMQALVGHRSCFDVGRTRIPSFVPTVD